MYLLYCPYAGVCFIAGFYYQEVENVFATGRLDVAAGGGWGAREGCEGCEYEWPQYAAPAPEPVDEGGPPSWCNDTRDTLLEEYANAPAIGWFPGCHDFNTPMSSTYFNWGELNHVPGNESQHAPWAITRTYLWSGLDATRVNFGSAMTMTSGYRCPVGNILVGSTAQQSRHMFGDAGDSKNGGWSQTVHDNMRSAAITAGASYTTSWGTYPDQHLHMDWR